MHRLSFAQVAAVTVSLLAVPAAARADSWLFHPDINRWSYETGYAAHMSFACPAPVFLRSTCSSGVDFIRYANGLGSLTLTFSGNSSPLSVFGDGARPTVELGTLEATMQGDPFADPGGFPVVGVPFSLGGLVISTPGGASSGTSFGAVILAGGMIRVGTGTELVFSTSPRPAGVGYSALSYDYFSGAEAPINGGPVLLTATVGLIPEPATLTLAASGLLALAVGVRRRRA